MALAYQEVAFRESLTAFDEIFITLRTLLSQFIRADTNHQRMSTNVELRETVLFEPFCKGIKSFKYLLHPKNCLPNVFSVTFSAVNQ